MKKYNYQCRNAGMQKCRNAGMQECRNAGMQECRTRNPKPEILLCLYLFFLIVSNSFLALILFLQEITS